MSIQQLILYYICELLIFAYKNALACLFPASILLGLALTQLVPLPLPRYDVMLLLCLSVQGFMLISGLETRDELLVICVFHLLGLGMELFKVSVGSWSYPEAAYTKLGGVPLFSGFMYASVASFMTQAWRHFDLTLIRWPAPILVIPLGVAIYLNFITHHYIMDVRWVLTAGVFFIFWRSHVRFTVTTKPRSMPLPLAFFLIGIFMWIAENIGTFLGAWQYPYQTEAWRVVDLGKLSSWSLLVIVSFMIVAQLKQLKARLMKASETAQKTL